MNTLQKEVEQLRQWAKRGLSMWDSAVFWGRIQVHDRPLPVVAEEVIKICLNSWYFHLDLAKIELAEKYEAELGAGLLRVALVSSVWQRSKLICTVADQIAILLLHVGAMRHDEIEELKTYKEQPERIIHEEPMRSCILDIKVISPPKE